ncbi:hypothetical protein HCN44_005141 [Aphidius gifuensis]|uniref:Uncharacterized protein n=1 Tax=Aphidius gifuensis TaxID=684658 RepID=A0A834XWF7_APHGI|nr:uncharacterized protein LOC122852412 [Aphidius gifuensis]KAF7992797.1 hypothetical protein HCN44_005141 [Aphidius gifuensis]
MAKNIQNLIKLSSTLRGLSTIAPRISQSMPVRLYQTSSQLNMMNEKCEPVQYYMSEIPSSSSKKNIKVSRLLNEYQSNTDILHLLQTEGMKIDGTKAVKILEALFAINKSKEDKNSISQRKEFSLLCEVLKRDIRQLTDGKAITALKCLNYFGIPTTTVIVQMLLQMIRQTINTLSLEQIIFLDFLLKRCHKTPLVEALTIALPFVFDTHVQTKLNMENFDSLIGALDFSRKSPESYSDAIPKIIKALNKADPSNITPKMAVKLSFIFLDLPIKKLEPIISNALNALSNSVDILQPNEISAIIHKLLKKQLVKNSHEFFYHENLMDNCVTSIITKDMGFTVAVEVLKNLSQMPYVSLPLLDYIASKCYEDITLLKNANHHEVETLISALATADYKPVFWDTIKDYLFREEMLNDTPLSALKLAINFSILKCYWPKLLDKVFSIDLADQRYLKKVLFLHEIVKMNYPQYKSKLPSDKTIKSLKQLSKSGRSSESLKSALEVVTGGEQYIISNRTTKFGYYIDQVVMMRKGGFPIAINSIDESFPMAIEDVTAIPDSQVILFIYVSHYGYIPNTQKLSGFWSLLLKSIRDETKHTVIPIHTQTWTKLSEAEQVRYLSKTLRLESDEFSAINT